LNEEIMEYVFRTVVILLLYANSFFIGYLVGKGKSKDGE